MPPSNSSVLHRDAVALPAAAGLDAEEVEARRAVGVAGQGLAPARFQRGLREQVARIDAELLAGCFGAGPELLDELFGRVRTPGRAAVAAALRRRALPARIFAMNAVRRVRSASSAPVRCAGAV